MALLSMLVVTRRLQYFSSVARMVWLLSICLLIHHYSSFHPVVRSYSSRGNLNGNHALVSPALLLANSPSSQLKNIQCSSALSRTGLSATAQNRNNHRNHNRHNSYNDRSSRVRHNTKNSRNTESAVVANMAGDGEIGADMRGSGPKASDIDNSTNSSQPVDMGMPFSPYDQADREIPSPFNAIVDVNVHRKSIIYEVNLGRDLGFEILEDFMETAESPGSALVGKMIPNSRASILGIIEGDKIVATSQAKDSAHTYTPGSSDHLWAHESAEGVRSALAARFQSNGIDHVTMRFERPVSRIDPDISAKLKMPLFYTVSLKRPIGLEIIEGPQKKVYVRHVQPSLGASKTGKVTEGDRIVSMRTFWGNGMRMVDSLETLVTGVGMSTAPHLIFGIRRDISVMDVMTNTQPNGASRFKSTNRLPTRWSDPISISGSMEPSSSNGSVNSSTSTAGKNFLALSSASDNIDSIKSKSDLSAFWDAFKTSPSGSFKIDTYLANKLMSIALRVDAPDLAVDVFEQLFGFQFVDPNPSKSLLKLFSRSSEESNAEVTWHPRESAPIMTAPPTEEETSPTTAISLGDYDYDDDYDEDDEDDGNSGRGSERGDSGRTLRLTLKPNNYVCTTAVKAYGRLNEIDKAMAVLPWMEGINPQNKADIYFMTALLHVCAKAKRVVAVEKIFWEDIPARKLVYTVATINSLMYLYAKLNRADEVLKLYETMKTMELTCSVVTYGVIIKALIRSGKIHLQEAAYEVLKSLPSLGIRPGVEVYNQLFEFYANTHNYRQTKSVLKMMSQSKPRVKPDEVSYGYMINCFADSKKPRSAMQAFYQMRKQHIAPNSFTYMGALKALSAMKDGLSALQVLQEMYSAGVRPDKRHYSMAMFACVLSNQCIVAEQIIELYFKQGRLGAPDIVLCTLWLRALLQQGKWEEGLSLLEGMESRTDTFPKPNQHTYNYLLRFQITSGRFTEALETLSGILVKYTQVLKRSRNEEGGMQRTILALSFALGSYSEKICRMDREDNSNALRLAVASAVRPLGVLTDHDSNNSGRLEPSYNPLLPSPLWAHLEDDTSLAEHLATHSAAPMVYGVDTEENSAQALTRAGVINTHGEPAVGTDIAPSMLERPSTDGLHFLVSAVELIGKHNNILLPASFYTELLRALLMEGQPTLAKNLLQLRKVKGIRLKADEKQNEQIDKAEKMALTAIEEGLVVQGQGLGRNGDGGPVNR